MVIQKPAQEPYILAEARNLYQFYSDKDLQHNAREIFRFALDGVDCLIRKYEKHPLAVELQGRMVNHAIHSYRIANPQRG